MDNRLESIINEMEDVEKRRNDLDIPLNALRMSDEGLIQSDTYGELTPSPASINRLCTKFKLSNPHINTLIDEGRQDLVADQFNHFLSKDKNKMKLRCVDDRIKGIVNSNYKKFDDYDMFWQVYEQLKKTGMDYEIDVLNNDDEYTRIRFMFSDTQQDFGMTDEGGLDNDILKGGFELTNSEIGMKRTGLNSLVYRQICTNGMMGLMAEGQNESIFGNRGREFNPFSRRNLLSQGMDDAIQRSNNSINLFRKTKGILVPEPYDEIDKLSNKYKLSNDHREGVKESYNVEKQRNYFGVINGFSRFATDSFGKKDYKNRSRFEFIASDVLEKVTT